MFLLTKGVNSKRDQYVAIGFTAESLSVMHLLLLQILEKTILEGKTLFGIILLGFIVQLVACIVSGPVMKRIIIAGGHKSAEQNLFHLKKTKVE